MAPLQPVLVYNEREAGTPINKPLANFTGGERKLDERREAIQSQTAPMEEPIQP